MRTQEPKNLAISTAMLVVICKRCSPLAAMHPWGIRKWSPSSQANPHNVQLRQRSKLQHQGLMALAGTMIAVQLCISMSRKRYSSPCLLIGFEVLNHDTNVWHMQIYIQLPHVAYRNILSIDNVIRFRNILSIDVTSL